MLNYYVIITRFGTLINIYIIQQSIQLMAKGKKNKKKNAFYKAIKPFIKDNRVLFSILGAAGVGAVLAAALGPEKVSGMVERVSGAINGFAQNNLGAGKKNSAAKQPAGA